MALKASEVTSSTCQALFTVFVVRAINDKRHDYYHRLKAVNGIDDVVYVSEGINSDGNAVHELKLSTSPSLPPTELESAYFNIGTILRS